MKEAMADFNANALTWNMQEGRKVNMSSEKKKNRKGCSDGTYKLVFQADRFRRRNSY